MKRIIALGAILLMITAVGCKEENESKVEDNTIKSEERVEKVDIR
ncbi:MAG: hypothetical protein Q4P31_07455 [Andreesenia angusta]|nr:hypothetical protein [Andreesenia angusta]